MNETTMYTVRVLKDLTFWDIASVLSSTITALFTAGLFFLAFFQLRSLNRNNNIKTILDLEAELYQRQSKIDEVSSRLRVAYSSEEKNLAEIYSDDLDAAIQNYLNALDRLCYCIIKGYLADRNWKSEYHDLLKVTVRENASNFGPGTSFRNIIKLLEKWDDQN